MALESIVLAHLHPWRAAPAWSVAFSGGLDSTVLLHLLVQLSRRVPLPPLRALHVQHGLQVVADAWPAHCQRFCDGLGVPLQVLPVQVGQGASLERAAREARYQAFEQALGDGELLLQAQHRDDQAETVLYRMLRGAGVRGLAAMPPGRRLGRGQLLRPLLDVPRDQLLTYARQCGLGWIEDPSNTDTALARNFLRHDILPRLQRHWPRAAAVLARAATHQAEAQQLLDELAELDLQGCQAGLDLAWLELPCLDLVAIRRLSDARQRNLLRHWLGGFTRLPDTRHWQGWADLRDAVGDAQPRWCLEGGELRRHAGRLLWLGRDWLQPWACQSRAWPQPRQPLSLPGNGYVNLHGAAPPGELSIAYRQGGEVVEVPGRGRRDLKRLLQEWQVPEFLRPRLPLLFADGRLIAVANLLPCPGYGRFEWVVPAPRPVATDLGA